MLLKDLQVGQLCRMPHVRDESNPIWLKSDYVTQEGFTLCVMVSPLTGISYPFNEEMEVELVERDRLASLYKQKA